MVTRWLAKCDLHLMRMSIKEPTTGFRLLYYAVILAISGGLTAWLYFVNDVE